MEGSIIELLAPAGGRARFDRAPGGDRTRFINPRIPPKASPLGSCIGDESDETEEGEGHLLRHPKFFSSFRCFVGGGDVGV